MSMNLFWRQLARPFELEGLSLYVDSLVLGLHPIFTSDLRRIVALQGLSLNFGTQKLKPRSGYLHSKQ